MRRRQKKQGKDLEKQVIEITHNHKIYLLLFQDAVTIETLQENADEKLVNDENPNGRCQGEEICRTARGNARNSSKKYNHASSFCKFKRRNGRGKKELKRDNSKLVVPN